MEGLHNFINFLMENWTSIVVLIALIVMLVRQVISFFSKKKEEQMEIIKKQIQEIILKWIADAEFDFEGTEGAGALKRAEVIEQVFTMFPELEKYTNQDELIQWLDELIDESLETLRDIIEGELPEIEGPEESEVPEVSETPEAPEAPEI